MNWSTMGSIWHNFTGNALNYDMHEYVKYFIQSISQDDLGMIYSSHNNFMVGMSQIGEGISQGWPFPIWTQSGNKSTAFEFNSGEQDEKLWTASDGAEFSVNDKGYAVFSFKGNSSEDSFRKDGQDQASNASGVSAWRFGAYEIFLHFGRISE